MTLLILTETAAGYALFKAKDKKLLKRDDLAEGLETAEGISTELKLKQFLKYDSAAVALEQAAALSESKISPMLRTMLESLKEEKKVSLAVQDPKLANAVSKLPGLSISPIADSSTSDIFRAIREHLPSLIPGLMPDDVNTMSLGLSHSLSRHKLKFSPDKVDTMIIQAIGLLDDLDKELNIYAMRVREWYGWTFPELGRICNDNLAYAKLVLNVGMRSNYATTDLSDILPEEIEGAVKAAAEVSMGTGITDGDITEIKFLAEMVVSFTEYRLELSSYLSNRMQAIAPNLTALVGELVGARLIAHAGSLMNLSKSPASTIQVLGAEKALFRALKTKHDTPKYGLIYHASLIGQATGKNKGKIARMLAAKAALGLRVDSLSEWGADREGADEVEPSDEVKSALGNNARVYIERRLRALEGRPLRATGTAIGPGGQTAKPAKFEIKEARKYNADADGLTGDEPAASGADLLPTPKADKKNKKPLIQEVDDTAAGAEDDEMSVDSDEDSSPAKPTTNGTDSKAQKKAEKEARRAEKAAKKAAKEAKKASKAVKEQEDPDRAARKAAKKAAKHAAEAQANGTSDVTEKKRKRGDDETGEKKKKKKRSSDV